MDADTMRLTQLVKEKRFAEAEKEARAQLVKGNGDPVVVQSLVAALVNQGQEEEALAELKVGASKHPRHAGLRYNLAVLQQRKGDIEAARQGYQAVLAIDPAHQKAAEALRALPVPADAPAPAAPQVPTARDHLIRQRMADEEAADIRRRQIEADQQRAKKWTTVAGSIAGIVLLILIVPWLHTIMQPRDVRAAALFDQAEKLLAAKDGLQAGPLIERGLRLSPQSSRGLYLSGEQGLMNASTAGLEDLFKGGLITDLSDKEMQEVRDATQAFGDSLRYAQERNENPIPSMQRNAALSEVHYLLSKSCATQAGFDQAHKPELSREARQNLEEAVQLDPNNKPAKQALDAIKFWEALGRMTGSVPQRP